VFALLRLSTPFTKGYPVSCGAYNVYQPDRGKDRKELVNKNGFWAENRNHHDNLWGKLVFFYPEL